MAVAGMALLFRWASRKFVAPFSSLAPSAEMNSATISFHGRFLAKFSRKNFCSAARFTSRASERPINRLVQTIVQLRTYAGSSSSASTSFSRLCGSRLLRNRSATSTGGMWPTTSRYTRRNHSASSAGGEGSTPYNFQPAARCSLMTATTPATERAVLVLVELLDAVRGGRLALEPLRSVLGSRDGELCATSESFWVLSPIWS